MIALIQRASRAEVRVAGKIIGAIDRGILALVAVQPDDTEATISRMAEKILKYRIFSDQAGKMNRSLLDVGGGLLLVSQFTLAADTGSGLRPSFSRSAPPDLARERFDALVTCCRQRLSRVETGQFGADMQVSLTNDGPVTFWLQV